jgi:hypothetical protein
MSRETPKDDPRRRTDEGSLKQTDTPWKGNPERSSALTSRRTISKHGSAAARTDAPLRPALASAR